MNKFCKLILSLLFSLFLGSFSFGSDQDANNSKDLITILTELETLEVESQTLPSDKLCFTQNYSQDQGITVYLQSSLLLSGAPIFCQKIEQWAQSAASLSAKDHRTLVFYMLEKYMEADLKQKWYWDLQFRKLQNWTQSQSLKPSDGTEILSNAIEDGLLLYMGLHALEFYYGKSGRAIGTNPFAQSKRSNPESSNPKRIDQQEGRVQLLGDTTKGSITKREKLVDRARSLSGMSQSEFHNIAEGHGTHRVGSRFSMKNKLGLAAGAGLVSALVEYAAGNVSYELNKKIPPLDLLRLAQIYKACELSKALANLSEKCSGPSSDCAGGDGREAAKKKILDLSAQALLLSTSFPDLQNMGREDMKEMIHNSMSEELAPALQKTVGELVDIHRLPECERIAINQDTNAFLLDNSGLLNGDGQDPKDKKIEEGSSASTR